MRVCEQCGADLGPLDPSLPVSTREWCSSACADKATANEPGWVRVEDMTQAQRAELDHILKSPSDIPSPEVAAVLLDKLRPSLDKARWDEFGDRVWLKPCLDEPTTFTCSADEIFNVEAYKPGDYKQFYADPRTREEYIKWAPLLLVAEDFHAGKRTIESRGYLK